MTRADWLTELRDPAKADAIRRYMHHWWLMVPTPASSNPAAGPWNAERDGHDAVPRHRRDHAVSLAFYLGDPDGNGIELYVDRPAEDWEWKDGKVTMGSKPLDPNAFMNNISQQEQRTPRAWAMYTSGWATWSRHAPFIQMPWVSRSPPRPKERCFLPREVTTTTSALTRGPAEFRYAQQQPKFGILHTVQLGSADELASVEARLQAAGVGHRTVDNAVVTQDPWGNAVALTMP